MKELKITKDRVVKASESCPDAKSVLRELFPEAFEDEWRDITQELQLEFEYCGTYYYLKMYHGNSRTKSIGTIYPKTGVNGQGIKLWDNSFKLESNNDGLRILKAW